MADAGEVVIVDAKGMEHVFPPGFDPKRAAGIVRQQSAPAAPPAPTAKPMTMLGRPLKPEVAATIEAITKAERQRTSEGARLMPAALGAVGGFMGGIPGAALGGAAGKAVEQTVLRGNGDASVPATTGGQAKAIGIEGALQGAMEGGGQVVMAGAGKLASWLMNRATTRVTAKLMQEFPELSDTLIEHALTVSQGGYGRALSLLKSAKSKATAALTKAESAGAVVPIQFTPDIADSFKTALIEQAIKSGSTALPKGESVTLATSRLPIVTRELIAKAEAAADGGAFELTAKQADLLKTQLQKESRALYANRTAPNGPKAMQAEATLKAEFASRLNDALDGIADGYKAANAETKTFIGATRGIKQAIRPSGNLMQAMVRPAIGAVVGGSAGAQQGHSTTGAMIGAAAATPMGLSGAAIALKNPAVQQFLRQLPRAAYEAVIAAVQGPPAQTQTPR